MTKVTEEKVYTFLDNFWLAFLVRDTVVENSFCFVRNLFCSVLLYFSLLCFPCFVSLCCFVLLCLSVK